MMNKITESEEIILNLLWQKESLSIMQMVKALETQKNWSKQTIISFLKRMEQKGTVAFFVQGRTKYYYAVIKREDVIRTETKGLMDRFFGGKMGAMVSYMVKESEISKEDIQELQTLLQKLKEDNENHEGKCH
ncbi:MAG: BlaI/MecI/CopY family transcriptional regulator [Lachnospiraceae bacterium]|nr:BlaI/MecI/CopY family transcriptional regulator [Lachnospiraceae bacterium]